MQPFLVDEWLSKTTSNDLTPEHMADSTTATHLVVDAFDPSLWPKNISLFVGVAQSRRTGHCPLKCAILISNFNGTQTQRCLIVCWNVGDHLDGIRQMPFMALKKSTFFFKFVLRILFLLLNIDVFIEKSAIK